MKKVIIGLAVFSFLRRFENNPPIFYVDKIPFNYNGLTIPPFGIFIKKGLPNNENLVLHEMTHWQQFQRNGLLLFLVKYLLYNAKYGYDQNPFEIEARFMESDFCQSNYTYCVRNGLSVTVENQNFRK